MPSIGQFSSVPFCTSTTPTISNYRRHQSDIVARDVLVAQLRLGVIEVAEDALEALLEHQVLYTRLTRERERDALTKVVYGTQDAVHVGAVQKNHENGL